MKTRWCYGLLGVLAILSFVHEATARSNQTVTFPRPFAIGNQSPVVGVFGIPKAQGPDLLEKGKIEWGAAMEFTSHFNEITGENEDIILDGETTRVAVQLRYGLNDDWTVGLEVPWIRHSGGFLDRLIIDWHDFWGLPQNGRDTAPKDRLLFRYRRKDQTLLNLDSPAEGIGDIVVSMQRLLNSGRGNRIALHTQLKLPTGEAAKLTGSGAVDAGAGIELHKRWHESWYSSIRAGLAYLGDGDVLPDSRRNFVAYGGFDVVWRPFRKVSFSVQYDAHAAPYRDSSLGELTCWSGMLTTGGTVYVSPSTALDLAVVENVPNASAVPDVSLYVRLRMTTGQP